MSATSTLGPEYKDARTTVRYNLALIVAKLFNFAVNVSDAKQSARKNKVFVVSKFVVRGTQCICSVGFF